LLKNKANLKALNLPACRSEGRLPRSYLYTPGVKTALENYGGNIYVPNLDYNNI
jgi:hypothetical protein